MKIESAWTTAVGEMWKICCWGMCLAERLTGFVAQASLQVHFPLLFLHVASVQFIYLRISGAEQKAVCFKCTFLSLSFSFLPYQFCRFSGYCASCKVFLQPGESQKTPSRPLLLRAWTLCLWLLMGCLCILLKRSKQRIWKKPDLLTCRYSHESQFCSSVSCSFSFQHNNSCRKRILVLVAWLLTCNVFLFFFCLLETSFLAQLPCEMLPPRPVGTDSGILLTERWPGREPFICRVRQQQFPPPGLFKACCTVYCIFTLFYTEELHTRELSVVGS